MLDEDAVGLVADWRRSRFCGRWRRDGRRGDVRERVVRGVDPLYAHLELVGIGGVVKGFFLRNESRLK